MRCFQLCKVPRTTKETRFSLMSFLYLSLVVGAQDDSFERKVKWCTVQNCKHSQFVDICTQIWYLNKTIQFSSIVFDSRSEREKQASPSIHLDDAVQCELPFVPSEAVEGERSWKSFHRKLERREIGMPRLRSSTAPQQLQTTDGSAHKWMVRAPKADDHRLRKLPQPLGKVNSVLTSHRNFAQKTHWTFLSDKKRLWSMKFPGKDICLKPRIFRQKLYHRPLKERRGRKQTTSKPKVPAQAPYKIKRPNPGYVQHLLQRTERPFLAFTHLTPCLPGNFGHPCSHRTLASQRCVITLFNALFVFSIDVLNWAYLWGSMWTTHWTLIQYPVQCPKMFWMRKFWWQLFFGVLFLFCFDCWFLVRLFQTEISHFF